MLSKIVKALRVSWAWLQQPIPVWLKNLVEAIAEIALQLLKTAGREYIHRLETYIVNTKNDYPNASDEKKFEIVFNFAKELLPNLKDWEIDTLIQSLFARLKKSLRV